LSMNEGTLWCVKAKGSAMGRRLTGILGIFALAVAFLPGMVDGLGAAQQLKCCAGTLCPMHSNGGQKLDCDMDFGHQGAELQACPSANQHYAALAFVPTGPADLFAEWLVDSAPVFAPPAAVNNGHDVAPPPPRSVPA